MGEFRCMRASELIRFFDITCMSRSLWRASTVGLSAFDSQSFTELVSGVAWSNQAWNSLLSAFPLSPSNALILKISYTAKKLPKEFFLEIKFQMIWLNKLLFMGNSLQQDTKSMYCLTKSWNF